MQDVWLVNCNSPYYFCGLVRSPDTNVAMSVSSRQLTTIHSEILHHLDSVRCDISLSEFIGRGEPDHRVSLHNTTIALVTVISSFLSQAFMKVFDILQSLQSKGSNCVAWSCDTLLSAPPLVDNKVSQLHATQSEPLDYTNWSVSRTFMKAYETNLISPLPRLQL